MQAQLEQLRMYVRRITKKRQKHKALKQKKTPYSIITRIFKQNITRHVVPTITVVTVVAAVQEVE
eukprot:15067950-Ditylum_brightwellii.AAC.1